MTTFDQLVRQVRQQLLGFALNQESVSELMVTLAPGDTTFQADPETVGNISRGLVEIDDELILVKKWDPTSGSVTVMGGLSGRGYEGTTAAAHAAHTLITSNPAFPKARIKEAINQTVSTLYPELVVFSSTEITKLAPQVEYALPSDLSDVWYVTGQMIGPSKVWQPLPNWRYNPKADPTVFPSGKSIQVFDAVTPGQSIRVVYAKTPNLLANGSDDFAATTGYPDRYVDLVVYGTCMRLLPALESARLQQQSIEATERATLVPPASAAKAMTMYAQLYQQRLQEERDQLYADVPNYAFFQGS
ncbi:phage adaptor protein [Streptomyces misionensis]|uniref:phage adaptor protein n=1 Tax=Streptomyces misionensis TaxID=67331 RepID=UPI0036A19434